MSDDTPLIEIDTLKSPLLYSPRQLRRAMIIAATMGAKTFVLCEKPKP